MLPNLDLKKTGLSCGLVLLFGSLLTAQAQQAERPSGTLKAKSREVVLPVLVRDKKGQPVPNLKLDDITLNEDGRPQRILSFTRQTDLPFRLGLLVDTSRSQQSALPGERSASGNFLDQMLTRPEDKAFLLHFDRDVELLQDFTGGKARLHRELDEMAPSKGSTGSSGSDEPGGGEPQQGGMRRGGPPMYDAIYLAATELMKSQTGRKAIVVLSEGVDRGSKETLNDAIDEAEKANLTVFAIYFKGQDERRGGEPGMIQRGGGGYPGGGGGGYPGGGSGRRGGQTPSGAPEPRVDGKKILEQIATRTGGLFFEVKKKDGFEEAFHQIAEQLNGEYLLTYSPDKSKPKDDSDGFCKLTLKVNNDQWTALTREGYYAAE